MRPSRHPQIGDLIIRKTDSGNYPGIVRQIDHDIWGHARHVHIYWADQPAPDYNNSYGYAGMNIHNLRHEFDVIRNGVSIK